MVSFQVRIATLSLDFPLKNFTLENGFWWLSTFGLYLLSLSAFSTIKRLLFFSVLDKLHIGREWIKLKCNWHINIKDNINEKSTRGIWRCFWVRMIFRRRSRCRRNNGRWRCFFRFVVKNSLENRQNDLPFLQTKFSKSRSLPALKAVYNRLFFEKSAKKKIREGRKMKPSIEKDETFTII